MNTHTLTHSCVQIEPNGQPMQFLKALPKPAAAYLVNVIYQKAQHATDQMIVISWTKDLPDHIYRAMKDYRYSPGIRVVFHLVRDGLFIDRINWRDCDPYGDGK